MKPETAAYLDKARGSLEKAAGMLDRWPDEAGRAAYLAGFHAAQALIYEQTGRSVKTHKGVQSLCSQLLRDSGLDVETRAFLGMTYNLKSIADYEIGPGAKVTPQMATDAIAKGRRFLAAIITLLAPSAAPRPVDPQP